MKKTLSEIKEKKKKRDFWFWFNEIMSKNVCLSAPPNFSWLGRKVLNQFLHLKYKISHFVS